MRYDFRRPTKLSREHVRTLQMVFETFARQFSTLLATSMHTIGQVNPISIEQQSYDEYVSALENPTIMAILTVDPLPGAGVLELSLTSAMTCVDHMLGGPGAEEQPQRPLTDIEKGLIAGFVERILSELRYAFEPLVRLEPKFAAFEFNPQFAQVASAADMVLVASFDLHLGVVEDAFTICLPFNALLGLLEAIGSQGGLKSDNERLALGTARRDIAARMADVPIDVAVRFAATQMQPADLMELQVGDVVPLSHQVDLPLSVTAGGVVFGHAVAGAQGKRLAVLVVDPPQLEES